MFQTPSVPLFVIPPARLVPANAQPLFLVLRIRPLWLALGALDSLVAAVITAEVALQIQDCDELCTNSRLQQCSQIKFGASLGIASPKERLRYASLSQRWSEALEGRFLCQMDHLVLILVTHPHPGHHIGYDDAHPHRGMLHLL
ncbi:hypothetical protein FKP32DRAFT_1469185 [Trametes sanguinea]|nr:hypothetical protein FKP32DRAFT_1469185 [Trametes sanguinea]